MRRRSNELIAVVVIAGLSAVLTIFLPANSIVRLLCALPLVFFLPGYAITSALLTQGSLGGVERLLFSLGTSVAVTALSGLVLHLTPWGLQTSTWAIMLAVIVLVAGAIAWLRQGPDARVTPAPVERRFSLHFRDGIFVGLAVLVAGAAFGLTKLPAGPNGIAGYTSLWMVPANQTNSNDFRLGIKSSEFSDTNYRLQISVGGQVVQEWTELNLKPGQTWETEITLQSNQIGSGPVVANLYKLNDPGTIYRYVKIWRGG